MRKKFIYHLISAFFFINMVSVGSLMFAEEQEINQSDNRVDETVKSDIAMETSVGILINVLVSSSFVIVIGSVLSFLYLKRKQKDRLF